MFKILWRQIVVALAAVSVLAAVMSGCSGDPSLDGFGMPEFESISAKAVGNSVSMTCSYKGSGVGTCGFAMAKTGESVKKLEAGSRKDGLFSLTINGLEYDTEYTYYAWISNGMSEIHSNTGTVHTEQKPVTGPEIVRVSFEVDENVLKLHCSYKGEDVDGCGFYFNGSDKMGADNLEEGKFSLTISGLEYDKEYEFQAYLTSGQTEVKSETMKARTGKMSSVPIADAAFKAYILGKYDLDKNGKLSMEEAEKITRLEINTYDLQIQSMEGIEYFKNLEYLKAVGHDDTRRGGLTTLDLSKNTKLQTLYCSFNKLETIDFGGNPSLKYIDCSSNMLYNVNEWDPKPDFNNLTALEYLDCHSNEGLVVLLGGNDYLKYIDCSYTVGQEYFGDCPSLEYLDISYCTIFSGGGSLNISGLKSLKTLKSEGIGGFYEFDASGCVNLELDQSFFKENGSTILKLRGCSKLTSMDISAGANSTNYIDVTDCKNLKSLKCNYRVVDELYVSGCTALTELECYGNFLHELDVSSQKKLNLKAWPQTVNFDKLWIGSGEYHYFNEDGQEVDPADYGTEVIIKE